MLLGSLSPRRRDRRNLASAFVGEIVAAMEAVEEYSEVRRLHLASLTASQISAPRRSCDWSIAAWTGLRARKTINESGFVDQ